MRMTKGVFGRGVNFCQGAIVSILRSEAALTGTEGREYEILPLIKLAARQCKGLVLNPDLEIRYHAVGCWNSVGNMLAETPGARSDEARILEGCLAAAGSGIPAEAFFEIILENWSALSNFTYTFRAAADIVEMSEGWPDDEDAIDELDRCLYEEIGVVNG